MMLKTGGLNTVVHFTNICRLVASCKNLCLLKFRGGKKSPSCDFRKIKI